LEAEEGECLVHSVVVGDVATHYVTWLASADRRGESTHLPPDSVWVLPNGLVSESPQIEKHSTLVEIMLVDKLRRREAPRLQMVHVLVVCSELGINYVHELGLLDPAVVNTVLLLVLDLIKTRPLS